jgi:hypothetical protein
VEEMSNLIDLVPPLELCKLIPRGEFEDSVALWVFFPKSDKKFHLYIREDIDWSKAETFPAPTTDEILTKCKDIPGVLNPTLWWQGIWKVDCAINKSEKLSEEFFDNADFGNLDLACAEDKSAATAALKLWLKLKGIEA